MLIRTSEAISSLRRLDEPCPSSGELRMEYKRPLDTFDAILEECAADGWDGDEAVAIKPSTASTARELLRYLGTSAKPHITPTPQGHIAFEMQNSLSTIRKIYIEAHSNYTARAFSVKDDGTFTHIRSANPSAVVSKLREPIRVILIEALHVD
jgi:hypothetical protein